MRKYLHSILLASVALFISCNSIGQQQFLETGYMDLSKSPADNFYQFVNGKWLDTAHIPPTESGIGSFLDLRNKTRQNLRTLLDEAAKSNAKPGSIEQKVGDFYASGMDTATIEKLGYDPIKPILKKISDLKNAKDVMEFIAKAQTEMSSQLFNMFVAADDKNSSMNILVFYQGGLGLPDRDYYFKDDPRTMSVVAAYQAYIKKLFMLTGDDSTAAAKNAMVVYNFEKDIAGSHRTNVELRDPQSNYNKMAIADLEKNMPDFGWNRLLSILGVKADSVNVSQPAFYTKINELLKTTSIDTWKTYLRFHAIDESANALSSDFVNANFDYSKTLSGQKALKPRWQRMVMSTDGNLGEALGQLYVKKYFTQDAKNRMMELVNNLQKAFEKRIENLDWMSDATKVVAKAKLNSFLKKIGYPDKWRDYSKVTIDKGKYFDNLVSCSKNEYAYQISKVGKPVDKTEWGMSPPTINAYYNPTFNEIVFPAGILQFPFFDPNADDAINYGGIGMVIGHEMTHGFDDQGAQYDKDGNLKNWWSTEDSVKFVAKTQQVINLYNSFTVLDTVHVNGELTTGENIADFGGVAIAYDAFKMTKQGQSDTKIDGFTPDQRFFISIAQIWRTKLKDESIMARINTDPHSPAQYRVMGPLMNFEPFYKAFNVKPGDKMYVADSARIKIW